jgi:hypothetical protein
MGKAITSLKQSRGKSALTCYYLISLEILLTLDESGLLQWTWHRKLYCKPKWISGFFAAKSS